MSHGYTPWKWLFTSSSSLVPYSQTSCSRGCMVLNKSSSRRTKPPLTNCNTSTSLARENKGEQNPSPSMTRALIVDACRAPAWWSCACVPIQVMESCCEGLNMPPPRAAGRVPNCLLTLTVFSLARQWCFYNLFPSSNHCCFLRWSLNRWSFRRVIKRRGPGGEEVRSWSSGNEREGGGKEKVQWEGK